MDKFIQPMEPVRDKKIPKGENWLYEIKWDGIRGISYINQNGFDIYTKKGNKRTSYFPELKPINKLLKCNNAILDGEIVVFNEKNKPSFQDILTRERSKGVRATYYKKIKPVHYILFDCLLVNDEDIRGKSLSERKDILQEIIKENQTVAISRLFDNGQQLYDFVKQKNYEGIVSKQKNSPYVPGKKHTYWLKNKLSRKLLGAIGGIHIKGGRPASILIGIYRNEDFIYIGNVAIGLKEKDLTLLYAYSEELRCTDTPFINLVHQENTIWFKPILTCWINFLEWTNDGHLRHAKLLGFTNIDSQEAKGEEIVD